MRGAIILFSLLSLTSGMILLFVSFGFQWRAILFFFGLGLLSIGAAVTYTIGKRPYGYLGLGDLSVLVFFGLVGVLGSYYLFTKTISGYQILPALSMGLLSVAVLNVNNIRDIESDKIAGKYSIPVRLGRSRPEPFGERRLPLQAALDAVVHGPLAGELLDVPECRPILGGLRVLLRVVADDAAKDDLGYGMIVEEFRPLHQLAAVDDRQRHARDRAFRRDANPLVACAAAN
jgi:hypothetical protein